MPTKCTQLGAGHVDSGLGARDSEMFMVFELQSCQASPPVEEALDKAGSLEAVPGKESSKQSEQVSRDAGRRSVPRWRTN